MTSTDLAREVEDQLIATAEQWTHPMNWSVCLLRRNDIRDWDGRRLQCR